tara:strand:+ start:5205 stop:5564 length:360 start_codon:yes stop_codon:yes gene_type:complete
MASTQTQTQKKRKTASATKKPTDPDAPKKYTLTSDDNVYCSSIFHDFDTDDAITTPTAEEAFQFVLTFGKHKGETIATVMKTKKGRSYLKYVLEKWDALLPEQAIMLDFALRAWEEFNA